MNTGASMNYNAQMSGPAHSFSSSNTVSYTTPTYQNMNYATGRKTVAGMNYTSPSSYVSTVGNNPNGTYNYNVASGNIVNPMSANNVNYNIRMNNASMGHNGLPGQFNPNAYPGSYRPSVFARASNPMQYANTGTPAPSTPAPKSSPATPEKIPRMDMKGPKDRLESRLGTEKKTAKYWSVVENYLRARLAKSELDDIVTQLLGAEFIYLHNDFFMSIIHNASATDPPPRVSRKSKAARDANPTGKGKGTKSTRSRSNKHSKQPSFRPFDRRLASDIDPNIDPWHAQVPDDIVSHFESDSFSSYTSLGLNDRHSSSSKSASLALSSTRSDSRSRNASIKLEEKVQVANAAELASMTPLELEAYKSKQKEMIKRRQYLELKKLQASEKYRGQSHILGFEDYSFRLAERGLELIHTLQKGHLTEPPIAANSTTNADLMTHLIPRRLPSFNDIRSKLIREALENGLRKVNEDSVKLIQIATVEHLRGILKRILAYATPLHDVYSDDIIIPPSPPPHPQPLAKESANNPNDASNTTQIGESADNSSAMDTTGNASSCISTAASVPATAVKLEANQSNATPMTTGTTTTRNRNTTQQGVSAMEVDFGTKIEAAPPSASPAGLSSSPPSAPSHSPSHSAPIPSPLSASSSLNSSFSPLPSNCLPNTILSTSLSQLPILNNATTIQTPTTNSATQTPKSSFPSEAEIYNQQINLRNHNYDDYYYNYKQDEAKASSSSSSSSAFSSSSPMSASPLSPEHNRIYRQRRRRRYDHHNNDALNPPRASSVHPSAGKYSEYHPPDSCPWPYPHERSPSAAVPTSASSFRGITIVGMEDVLAVLELDKVLNRSRRVSHWDHSRDRLNNSDNNSANKSLSPNTLTSSDTLSMQNQNNNRHLPYSQGYPSPFPLSSPHTSSLSPVTTTSISSVPSSSHSLSSSRSPVIGHKTISQSFLDPILYEKIISTVK